MNTLLANVTFVFLEHIERMNHRTQLIAVVISSMAAQLLACCQLLPAAEGQPMNVLVLYADDWRHDTLGVAGHPIVQTPRLDQLASQGMRFTHNCVTTSICGVSRATLLTGQWMSRHGNRAFGSFKTPWSQTYPALLRKKGFYVGHVGKWHNGSFPAEQFDFGRSYNSGHWMKLPDGTKIHVTQRNERDALEFLRLRDSDKPFCLTVAFSAVHAEDHNPLQFMPQPESMKLYKEVQVPVPPNATDASFQRLPTFIANEKNEARNRWHWRFDTPEKYQSMMKGYFRMVTEVDASCGRIVDELETQGVLENTLVLFTTDNGYFHSEHGIAGKWYPHQESIRVPLIVRDPRMANAKQGETNDQLTLSVDLAPTILQAAGIKALPSMQGQDISPLYLAERKPHWRSEFFYEHPTIGSVSFIPASEALVTKQWKYFYWPDFQREQLFDLRNDPREEHDLATDPPHANRLAAMRARFAELRNKAR